MPTIPTTNPSLKTLQPYFSLLRGLESQLLLATGLMVISTAISLAIPLTAGHFVDTLGNADNLTNALTARHLTVLGLLLLLQLGGTFLFTVVSARLGLHTVTRLRRRLFAHLLELPALYFTDQKAGDLSSRITGDVGSIQYLLTSGLVSLARALLTLVGAMILMYRLNPHLTTFVLLLLPSTILLVRLFGSRLQKISRRMYDELGRVSGHVQETVTGIRTLKLYNNQNHEERRFDQMVTSYMSAGMRRAWLSAALESGIQISLWICLIGVVIYGFSLTARGATTNGELVAFLLLAFRVAIPLASLTNLFASAQGSIAAAGRLDDIFAVAPERSPGSRVPAPRHTPAGITLRDVTFAYPGTPPDQPILQGIDLVIEPGQWVGLVGPSGAGKTTLAGIIMGLFPPTTGSALLDDQDYTDYDLATLRSCMAFVAQDPVLYDMSLADNIRFGLTTATDADVRQAASHAGMLEFVDRLPQGLDTVCGEGGTKLSGGQKQRVSLARAFLRNPGLLILDEPTSAMDAASEQAIQHSLKTLMTGRTALVIAHRFSLVRELDVILVIEGGEIVETGNHEELMAKHGLYYKLFNMQQGTSKDRLHPD